MLKVEITKLKPLVELKEQKKSNDFFKSKTNLVIKPTFKEFEL